MIVKTVFMILIQFMVIEILITLQVHELTYYLNDYDPLTNFQSSQIYYSNRDYYTEGFVGAHFLTEELN